VTVEDRECCANTVVGAVGDFPARRVHLVELGAVELQELSGSDDQGFEYRRNQNMPKIAHTPSGSCRPHVLAFRLTCLVG
jgi:hypothetical protein